MKKQFYFILFLFNLSLLHAQLGGLEDSVNNILDTIKRVFPLILGIIFLISAAINSGYFFGENQDIKKGVVRILTFVGIAAIIGGIFTYIITLTL